jgi:hypothetical protein
MGNKRATGATAPRTEKSIHDTKFHLEFLERLYDGSPRWWNQGWQQHVNQVPGDKYETLDREPGVKKHIDLAHGQDARRQFYGLNKVPFLVTCVNPTCPLRSWEALDFSGSGGFAMVRDENNMDAGPFPTVQARMKLQETVMRDVKALAEGKHDELQESCPQCSHKKPAFPVTTISNKWIYVLKESGESLTPYVAIYAQSPNTGFVYTRYKDGEFLSDGHAFDGRLFIDKIESHTWHFFLSPKKLGPRALKLLSHVPKEDPKYAQQRDSFDPQKWKVSVVPDLQPWSATVKRKFDKRQQKTPYEFIPLVDPFAWAAEVADFDYLPILAAQQKLIQDPDEQAKSFIASTLVQVIGTKKVSDNPPRWVEDEDKWDVRGETVAVPSSFASSSNIAQAWVNRYQSALDYLTQETNFACSRVWFPVRFSFAHRIVEQACQENLEDPEFLTYGLIHWSHILREMLACQAGEAFTTWLATNSEARDRIPQKNVLGGEGLGPKSKIADGDRVSLPLQVLVYISPPIVSSSDKPGRVLQEHLEKIGVHATTYGLKDALAVRDFALSVSLGAIDMYVKSLPEVLDASAIRKMTIAETWKGRIEDFPNTKAVEECLTLLVEISEYGKKEQRTDSEWERNAYKDNPGVAQKVKEKIETPAKVAKFLNEQAHKLMKATWLSGETQVEIVEKLEKEGLRKGFAALSPEQAEVYAAGRSLATFRWVGIGLKVLAGPVGVVIGGCEIAIQGGEMVKSLRAGDPGAAVAHGLQAAAAALIVVVAGAECVALFTGAATAAWAGPVGWIAAALMIIGGIIMAWCAKNDLQLYARHCFLGADYGHGDYDKTDKAWMGSWGWANLLNDGRYTPESKERFQRQRLALLRMLTGFTTWIGSTNPFAPGPTTYCGGFIFVSFVPAGAYLEVEVDVMPKGMEAPKETFKLAVWPDIAKYEWREPKPNWNGSNVLFGHRGSNVSDITVNAIPNGFAAKEMNWDLRVRLHFDASGKNGLPVTTKWVKNSSRMGWGIAYREVSSSKADTDIKEEGEEEEQAKEAGSGE